MEGLSVTVEQHGKVTVARCAGFIDSQTAPVIESAITELIGKKQYKIIIDLSKIGYQGKAYLTITNAPGQSKEKTIEALKKMPNMFLITDIIGEFDVLVIAAVRNFTSIMDDVNTIRKLPSVEQVEVTFVKDTMFPGPKEFNELFPPETNNHEVHDK